MSWQSVNDILGCLQIQTKLAEEPLQILLVAWEKIVGEVVAAHTQPTSIKRGVLRVATYSAVWSQNLTFERKRLLVKINSILPSPLQDIHFSTGSWQHNQNQANQTRDYSNNNLPQEHPSYIETINISDCNHQEKTSINEAFTNWKKLTDKRSQFIPLCPKCQCPTPPGEIRRWQVCSLCAAKEFR
ncbi:hypothetical protein RINTHH_6040 [Richelia intracellularis HH01]|uniref:Zn-ribbon-containing, possibly RNA-binding protein and truncated derivatives n=1 Tax=Richelia intracellularis HH01 TaxID=1165094 RepID=M1WR70_9NOST|nr:DciA family protein [Richelia intracellularis]CCH66759.1 hypothetical protein RINTHH_6040 [Richelia intracellularis HH01]HAE05445.1 DUF721 domain-containing protein [Richelia sp.]